MSDKLFIFHAFRSGAQEADLFTLATGKAHDVLAKARAIFADQSSYARIEIWTEGTLAEVVTRKVVEGDGG